MPEGENTPGQEPTNTSTTDSGGSSIESFPEEAQRLIRQLRQESAERRTALREATGKLKEFEDLNKSEQQKAQERAEAAERSAGAAELKLLRYEVAAEKGLPLKYAGRLQGATKADLEKDAEQLKQDFGLADGGSSAGGSGFDGGVRHPAPRPKTMNGLIRQAAGR